MNKSKSSNKVLGMALFAMFFGAGNLIYPIFVGANSKNSASSTIGFLLTAVLLPFIGVIAIVLFNGSYKDFFSVLGKKFSFIFSFILLTVWIPLGSAPRGIALAYSSISLYSNIGPIYIFSIIYTLAVIVVIFKKNGFINLLGRIITPLLIGSILIISIKGIFFSDHAHLNSNNFSYFEGISEGYNTMDLIASFFFSASIISILNKETKSLSISIKKLLRASLIGIGLLAVVYILLISVSIKHSLILRDIPKDQMLSVLSRNLLGANLSVVSLFAIVLACFSTSVALIVAYSEFLKSEIFKNKKGMGFSIAVSSIITFIMSIFGLNGVSFITSPILKIFYPVLLVLILVNIVIKTKVAILEKRRINEANIVN